MHNLDPIFASVNTVLLCLTLPLLMVTSPGHLWIMGTWALCSLVKTCAVININAMWRLWRENVASLCIVTARLNASGCRPKITSSFCSFLTSLVSVVYRTVVSRFEQVVLLQLLSLLCVQENRKPRLP